MRRRRANLFFIVSLRFTQKNRFDMFREFAPDGYFCIMIQLDTPDWYVKKHTDIPDSFRQLGNAIVCEQWKNDAADYLKAVISYCEKKYGDRIYCYSFSCGYATEWFSNDLAAGDENKLKAYREFYHDDMLEIPSYDELNDGECSLRADNKYLEYCCRLTPELVCFMAKKAREMIGTGKLIGLFFGYITMSSSKLQNLWLTNRYEKVWECKDIDIIFSPAAYRYSRQLENSSGYQIAVDSLRLHNKIYLHEIDHRTHLARYPLENGVIIQDGYKTEFETIQVLRRELCIALVKNSVFWWFDFYGGYYASPIYEAELERQLKIYNELSEKKGEQLAEIAVFVHPMCILTMKEKTDLIFGSIMGCIEQINKCGAPVEIYNMSDLKNINTERYKLFIFLNETKISDNDRALINEKLNDKYKLFVYAPDCIHGNRLDFERVGELCGMDINANAIYGSHKIKYNGLEFGYNSEICPRLEVTDDTAEKLGFYDDGVCGLAYKNKTFYCGAGNIPYRVFTDIAERAGVHIYYKNGIALCASTRFFMFATTHDENVEISMPFDCELCEKFSGRLYKTENKILRYNAKKGTAMLFEIKS